MDGIVELVKLLSFNEFALYDFLFLNPPSFVLIFHPVACDIFLLFLKGLLLLHPITSTDNNKTSGVYMLLIFINLFSYLKVAR